MAPPPTRPASVILDAEAVQALLDVRHPKHRDAIAVVQVVNDRRRRRSDVPRVIVPVAVRVEAGWDRAHRSSSHVNWVTRAVDWPLTTARADHATRIRAAADVSVVDATIGQAAHECPKPVTIVTSDVGDMTRIASALAGKIRVAPL